MTRSMLSECTMKSFLVLLLFVAHAHAAEPSVWDMIANATFVPSPSALPSMPSSERCKVVDAALANPNTDHARTSRPAKLIVARIRCSWSRERQCSSPLRHKIGALKTSRCWAIRQRTSI